MLLVTKRFQRKPVTSRVSVFPAVFSMTNNLSEGAESRSEPGIRFSFFWKIWHVFKPR